MRRCNPPIICSPNMFIPPTSCDKHQLLTETVLLPSKYLSADGFIGNTQPHLSLCPAGSCSCRLLWKTCLSLSWHADRCLLHICPMLNRDNHLSGWYGRAFDLPSPFRLLSSCISLHQFLGQYPVIFKIKLLSAFCFLPAYQISQMCDLNSELDFSKGASVSGLALHTLPSHVTFLEEFSNEVSLLTASVPDLHFCNSVVLK